MSATMRRGAKKRKRGFNFLIFIYRLFYNRFRVDNKYAKLFTVTCEIHGRNFVTMIRIDAILDGERRGGADGSAPVLLLSMVHEPKRARERKRTAVATEYAYIWFRERQLTEFTV